ncbi:hypothetical protein FHL15_006407 [Xylaria flabelliformis]|uniref:3-oxoacyl-[acyl-carrier-protein] reductase n=1 Tax=Xylaria flabelliformis TaxID=2512241 RepID=A0A553HXQ0_9PEZI|nr:hypothetical protein FHL15_006407 [Xylaria flabelliformis]
MLSIRGRRCVITGGSRGIGLAIAKLFAFKEANCTLIGRHEESLEKAVQSLCSKPLQSHKWLAFDVSDPKGWEELMQNKKSNPIDILVNAAGISQNSFLMNTPEAELDKILDVNLKGTILGCKSVILPMMKRKTGCIINISSLLATHGGRGASVYAASKAGIIGLTRSLAWEVGRFNVRANVIQPGYIHTDMTKGMNKDGDLAALIPMGRLGEATEVAEAALFLATNKYAHNCVLNIDGGLSAT